jgi:hypothetical protein
MKVPTARECMAEAYRVLTMNGPNLSLEAVTAAEQWIAMARELREEAMMRVIGQRAANQFHEAADKLRAAGLLPMPMVAKPAPTLSDVEAIVCAHGKVAAHWKYEDDYLGPLWLHTEDGTTCDDLDRPGDGRRRRSNWGPIVDTTPWPSAPRLDVGQRMEDEPEQMAGRGLRPESVPLARPYVARTEWERAQDVSKLDVTAVLAPTFGQLGPPVDGDHATCRNHDELNGLVFADGAWRHEANMQTLCPIPGNTVEGDETYHRFANPL